MKYTFSFILIIFSFTFLLSQTSAYRIGIKKGDETNYEISNNSIDPIIINHCLHTSSAGSPENLTLNFSFFSNGNPISSNEIVDFDHFLILAYTNDQNIPQLCTCNDIYRNFSASSDNADSYEFDYSAYPNCLPCEDLSPFTENYFTFVVSGMNVNNEIIGISQIFEVYLTTKKTITGVANDSIDVCNSDFIYITNYKLRGTYTNNSGASKNISLEAKNSAGTIITQLQSGTYSFRPINSDNGECSPDWIESDITVTNLGLSGNAFINNTLKNSLLTQSPTKINNNTEHLIYENGNSLMICYSDSAYINSNYPDAFNLSFNVEYHKVINNIDLTNYNLEVFFPGSQSQLGASITTETINENSITKTISINNFPKTAGTIYVKLSPPIETETNNCISLSFTQYIYDTSFSYDYSPSYIIQEDFPRTADHPEGTLSTETLINKIFYNNSTNEIKMFDSNDSNAQEIIPDQTLLDDWITETLNTPNTDGCGNKRTYYFDVYSTCATDENGYIKLHNKLKVEIYLFDIPPFTPHYDIPQGETYEIPLCLGNSDFTIQDIKNTLSSVVGSMSYDMNFYSSQNSNTVLPLDESYTFGSTDHNFWIANVGAVPIGYCGTYPNNSSNGSETISSRRVKVKIINDCCPAPSNFRVVSTTDTTALLRWLNVDIPPKPEGGWSIRYYYGNLQEEPDGEPIETFIVYEPELLLENLLPSNDYTFFIQSLCTENGNTSPIVSVPITTTCSGCSSFKPVPGKEYVVSAWVKEDWENTQEVSLVNSTVNTEKVRNMLNQITQRYVDNVSSDIYTMPNNSSVPALDELNAVTDDGNIFNAIFSDSNLTPSIYNFRYNQEIKKFQFQFVRGIYTHTENLLVNPGGEQFDSSNHAIGWSNNTLSIEGHAGKNGTYFYPTSGNRFLQLNGGGVSTKSSSQTIDVSMYSDFIDNGDVTFNASGMVRNYGYSDKVGMQVLFYDEDGPSSIFWGNSGILGVENSNFQLYPDWTLSPIVSDNLLPKGTRYIEFIIYGEKVGGNDVDAYFDELDFHLNYFEDNPAFPLQSYDVDCYSIGDYSFNTIQDITTDGTPGIIDPNHYPENKYFFNLNYDCGLNADGTGVNHVIQSKYNYGPNTFKFIHTSIPNFERKFQYNNSYIELFFLDNQNNNLSSLQMRPAGPIIDGWQRITGVFTMPDDTSKFKMELVNTLTGRDVFFDDVRVFPKKGNMKSFVYDPVSQKLMAELDENNFATFYEYDKEGGLIRVKKETEKGVFTIQETRSGNVNK